MLMDICKEAQGSSKAWSLPSLLFVNDGLPKSHWKWGPTMRVAVSLPFLKTHG